MKMPRTKRMAPPPRLVVVVVLAVILVITVIGWQHWRTVAAESTTWRTAATQAYGSVTAASEAATPAMRMQAVRTLADFSLTQPDCRGEWWYGWQADILPPIKTLAETCKANIAAVTSVSEAATVLDVFLKEEQRLVPILTGLTVDGAQADWQAKAVTAARQAETQLARFKPEDIYATVHGTALQQVRTIATRWRVIEEASKKQDRKAYEAAVEGLDDAYAALAVISDTSDDELDRLLDKFTVAGKTL